MLMMGAYASMTMQLFLFGIYLYGTKIREINRKLIIWVMAFKFILLPITAFSLLYFIELDAMIKGVIFLELMMPLAVANVNLASLYDCEPKLVTALVFISSALFLGVIFLGIQVLDYL
jgi:predicted permease